MAKRLSIALPVTSKAPKWYRFYDLDTRTHKVARFKKRQTCGSKKFASSVCLRTAFISEKDSSLPQRRIFPSGVLPDAYFELANVFRGACRIHRIDLCKITMVKPSLN